MLSGGQIEGKIGVADPPAVRGMEVVDVDVMKEVMNEDDEWRSRGEGQKNCRS